MIYHRVLVTGANGFIGQALVHFLSALPAYDVLAVGRSVEPRFKYASCGYVRVDLTDATQVRRLFVDFAPSLVIHAAAVSSVDHCEKDKDLCWSLNVEATETLARLCLQGGAKLMLLSTDFVFDGEDGPYEERERPKPTNFYGKSKLAAENVIRGAGLDQWIVIRTVLVFGHVHNAGRDDFVSLVRRTLSARKALSVTTNHFRTPTFIEDLVRGIEKAMRYNKVGVFHLAGQDYLSVAAFAREIAEVFALDTNLLTPVHSDQLALQHPRPERTGLIILRAQSEFGYRPHTLRKALEKMKAQDPAPSALAS